jgi:predicted nucleic acid-binding protein
MEEIDTKVKDMVLEHIHVVGEKQFTDADALLLLVAEKIDLSDKLIAATAMEYGYIIFTHDGDFLYSGADLLTSNGAIFRVHR